MVATARPPALERRGIYPGFTGLVQTWAFVTARRPDWPCNVALAYLPTPAKSTLCAHRTPGKGAWWATTTTRSGSSAQVFSAWVRYVTEGLSNPAMGSSISVSGAPLANAAAMHTLRRVPVDRA